MTKIKKSSFAEDYRDLQKLVSWFERDDLDLEEGIKKFEEGLLTVKRLKEYLGNMENKVKELKDITEKL